MFRYRLVAAFVGAVALSACATLIGLDEYTIEEGDTGDGGSGAGGSNTGGSGSGGDSSTGGAGLGGAATGGTSASGGEGGSACTPADCDDDNPCTDDACVDGACRSVGRGLGAECPLGVCTDDPNEPRCVRCIDTESGDDPDLGCPPGAPRCVDVDGESVCSGCTHDDDCAPPDECSSVTCTAEGLCLYAPLAEGTPCSHGVCDGAVIPSCGCTDASDCSDGVACTADSCDAGVCSSTPNAGLCTGNSAACVPDECATASGCRSEVILVNESSMYNNGSFEFGELPEPGPWQYISPYDLVYSCASGCESTQNRITYCSHGPRCLWLAGASNHQDEAYLLLTLPAGARRLEIRGDTSLQTQNSSPSNNDFTEVWLKNLAGTPLIATPIWRRTAEDAATSGVAWTADGLDVEVDVSPWAGSDIRFSIQASTNNSQRSDFFFDNIRITAVVCE